MSSHPIPQAAPTAQDDSELVERYGRWLQNTGFDGGKNSPPVRMLAAFKAATARLAEQDAEIARLREAGIALREDMLMRAEIWYPEGLDNPAEKIVAAGNGVWTRFCAALKDNDRG